MASYTPRRNKKGEIIGYQIRVARGRDPISKKQLTPYSTTYRIPKGISSADVIEKVKKLSCEFEKRCRNGEVLLKEERLEKALEKANESRTKEQMQRSDLAAKQNERQFLSPIQYVKEIIVTDVPPAVLTEIIDAKCARDQPQNAMNGIVYFISDGSFVKIGKSCTHQIQSRINALQIGNPHPLEILFYYQVKDATKAYLIETYLHNLFKKYRMAGEWFDIKHILNTKSRFEFSQLLNQS